MLLHSAKYPISRIGEVLRRDDLRSFGADQPGAFFGDIDCGFVDERQGNFGVFFGQICLPRKSQLLWYPLRIAKQSYAIGGIRETDMGLTELLPLEYDGAEGSIMRRDAQQS